MLYCVNENWDNDGSIGYSSVKEFTDMCEGCFDLVPVLVEDWEGDWFEKQGDNLILTLEKRDV